MEEWKTYELSDIANIVTGKTPSTKDGSNFGGSVHFITPGDINKGLKHVYATERTLTESGLYSIKGSIVYPNSICVSCIGNIGYVGMSTMKCATNQQINTLIVKDGFDSDFVYYLMRFLWPEFKNFEGQSTTLSILNKGLFSKIQVKIPSLTIQKKIANILSSLDNKIELNTRINHNLEEQAQALYKSWFVDFEPFKDGEFVDSELGLIPKGWRVGTLSELVEVHYGKDHKSLKDGDIPVYGSGGRMRYAERALFDKESVLIPRKGTLNNVMYVNHPFWTVDTMFYSSEKVQNAIKYAHLFLLTQDLASMNAGSAVPSMTTDILNNLIVLIPTQDVLEAFDGIVSALYSGVDDFQRQSASLSMTRDSLLPQLLSGNLNSSISLTC